MTVTYYCNLGVNRIAIFICVWAAVQYNDNVRRERVGGGVIRNPKNCFEEINGSRDICKELIGPYSQSQLKQRLKTFLTKIVLFEYSQSANKTDLVKEAMLCLVKSMLKQCLFVVRLFPSILYCNSQSK